MIIQDSSRVHFGTPVSRRFLVVISSFVVLHWIEFYLIMHTLGTIVFLGEFLVSEELRVHSSCGDESGSLRLLDTVGVSLVGIVVCTRVLLLSGYTSRERKRNNRVSC